MLCFTSFEVGVGVAGIALSRQGPGFPVHACTSNSEAPLGTGT